MTRRAGSSEGGARAEGCRRDCVWLVFRKGSQWKTSWMSEAEV